MIRAIGCAINTSRDGFTEWVANRNTEEILKTARLAEGCQMAWISLNCSSRGEHEQEDLLWLAKTIQDEIPLPLCIDSLNPHAVEAVLRVHRHGRPIVDSLNCEETRMDTFLPLVKKYDALGICLMMTETRMDFQVEARLECLPILHQKLQQYGVPPGDILLDPLVFALSTGDQYAKLFLDTVKAVKAQHPDFLTCCGLDNISHGLPLRDHINEVFLINCICAGIDSVMIIPTKRVNSFLRIQQMMEGKSEDCMDYIEGYRSGFME